MVEQTPWLPHIGTHAAQLLRVSAERYLQDAELLAQGALLCADRYACDGIPLVDDPQLEALSLGCVPHWSEQGPPSIISSPLYSLPSEQRNCSPMRVKSVLSRRVSTQSKLAAILWRLTTRPLLC